MIGGNEVESAVGQSPPERLSVARLADRWRTLESCRTVRHGFGGERQIVWTGFGSDGDAVRLCARHFVSGFGRGDMDDVRVDTKLSREADDRANRFDLGFGRTRHQVM